MEKVKKIKAEQYWNLNLSTPQIKLLGISKMHEKKSLRASICQLLAYWTISRPQSTYFSNQAAREYLSSVWIVRTMPLSCLIWSIVQVCFLTVPFLFKSKSRLSETLLHILTFTRSSQQFVIVYFYVQRANRNSLRLSPTFTRSSQQFFIVSLSFSYPFQTH